MEDNVPTSAGLSSFNLLDENTFFDVLALEPGMTLLDFACGVGNYALAASPYIGDTGVIHALDPWGEGIETLEVRIAIGGITNIKPGVADAKIPLPIPDQSVDVCLMATVVHILHSENTFARTMVEVQRVLKDQGTIAIVEFEKKDPPPGPPYVMRLAQEELAELLRSFGFTCTKSRCIGPHNYLSIFSAH